MTLNKTSLLALFALGKHRPVEQQSEELSLVFSQEPRVPLNIQERHQYFHGDLIIEKYGKYKNYYRKTFNPQQIASPFTASDVVSDPEVRTWVYIDEHNCFQGPFSSLEMDHWYNNELLPLDLLIGLIDREQCLKLCDFISATYPFEKNPQVYHVTTANKHDFKTPQTQPQSKKAFTFDMTVS